jgi:hypothetical protein
MSIISRYRFIFLIVITLLLFFIVYYCDEKIRAAEIFQTKVWFFFFKSIFIFTYGSLLFNLNYESL